MANINDYYKFKILYKLKPQISNIKFVYIFGQSGNEVIFVTKDDEVFGFGSNTNACLGFGHNRAIQEPTIINELTDKQIVDITSGNNFTIALTKYRELYSWGHNSNGTLGNGSNNNAFHKPTIISSLSGKNVMAMSCGHSHTLVLTQLGEVFMFGYNNVSPVQLTPTKVNGFNEEKVIQISCGTYHSLALTESGKVFSWGPNSSGELGNGSTSNQSSPKIVSSVANIAIKKISCGYAHSLLLSNDGVIYSFGSNSCGQLGNHNKINQNIPIKIVKSVKFKDIVSDFQSNISMALSQNGFVYFWGECIDGVVELPRSTRFTSFHDIFAIYAKRKITYKAFVLKQQIQVNRVIKTLSKAFNNPETSDLKIKIEDKYIYVQKWFLQNSCKHFESMLSKNWSEMESNEIVIEGYSYNVYFVFIKYLYTDCIELDNIEELIELLNIANSYLEEELKLKCVESMENKMTIENVCTLYSAAVKYRSEELEDLCFEFSINKLEDIRKTEAFEQMNSDDCKQLFAKFIDLQAFK